MARQGDGRLCLWSGTDGSGDRRGRGIEEGA